MEFPEPKSIPEYQAELVRAWGAILRVEDKVTKLVDTAISLRHDAGMLEMQAKDLLKAIQGVRHVAPHA